MAGKGDLVISQNLYSTLSPWEIYWTFLALWFLVGKTGAALTSSGLSWKSNDPSGVKYPKDRTQQELIQVSGSGGEGEQGFLGTSSRCSTKYLSFLVWSLVMQIIAGHTGKVWSISFIFTVAGRKLGLFWAFQQYQNLICKSQMKNFLLTLTYLKFSLNDCFFLFF